MANSPDLIGRLRQRIKIEEDRATTKNDFGERVPDWTPILPTADKHCSAAVEPLNGRELWNAVQMQADITHKITLRYRPDVTPGADLRAVMGDRVFHFAGPLRNIGERNEWWEVLAVEQVTNAG